MVAFHLGWIVERHFFGTDELVLAGLSGGRERHLEVHWWGMDVVGYGVSWR